MPAVLSERLLAMRDRWHIKNHRYFAVWVDGQLSPQQQGAYLIQHYLFVGEVFRAMSYVYARAPREVQRYVVSNLAEEHGLLGMEERGAEDHFETIVRFILACGYSRDVLHARNRDLWTAARIHVYWDVAARCPWQVYLAMIACLESQLVGLNERLVPALYRHYGYPPGDPAIRFFEEHMLADVEHGRRSFHLVDKYADTDALREQCFEVAELGCRYRWEGMNELHERVVVRGELPSDGAAPEGGE